MAIYRVRGIYPWDQYGYIHSVVRIDDLSPAHGSHCLLNMLIDSFVYLQSKVKGNGVEGKLNPFSPKHRVYKLS